MNAFVAVLCLAVAASASHVGIIGHGVHHHIPSGSVSVGHNGVVVAGPAGSIATDNGLHGHGAGTRISGPAGDVRTHGGHVVLHGPGNGHGDDGHNGGWGGAGVGIGGGLGGGLGGGWGHGHVAVVAPVAVVSHVGHGLIGHGHIGHGLIGHGGIAHGLVGHHGW